MNSLLTDPGIVVVVVVRVVVVVLLVLEVLVLDVLDVLEVLDVLVVVVTGNVVVVGSDVDDVLVDEVEPSAAAETETCEDADWSALAELLPAAALLGSQPPSFFVKLPPEVSTLKSMLLMRPASLSSTNPTVSVASLGPHAVVIRPMPRTPATTASGRDWRTTAARRFRSCNRFNGIPLRRPVRMARQIASTAEERHRSQGQ